MFVSTINPHTNTSNKYIKRERESAVLCAEIGVVSEENYISALLNT